MWLRRRHLNFSDSFNSDCKLLKRSATEIIHVYTLGKWTVVSWIVCAVSACISRLLFQHLWLTVDLPLTFAIAIVIPTFVNYLMRRPTTKIVPADLLKLTHSATASDVGDLVVLIDVLDKVLCKSVIDALNRVLPYFTNSELELMSESQKEQFRDVLDRSTTHSFRHWTDEHFTVTIIDAMVRAEDVGSLPKIKMLADESDFEIVRKAARSALSQMRHLH